MAFREVAVAILVCIAIAGTVGGLIAVVWHVIPEQYALLMRWVAYGLICVGVQCGCLLVRCMCVRQPNSWCAAVDHAVTPGAADSSAARRGPTTRTAGGVIFDPDEKPPAYSQVICEEDQPPPPFLDAVRRESMDEALQAETEAEFLREAQEVRRASVRRSELAAHRAETDARRARQLLGARRQEPWQTEDGEEGGQAEAEAVGAVVEDRQAEAEARQTEAEIEVRRPDVQSDIPQAELEDGVVLADSDRTDGVTSEATQTDVNAAEVPQVRTDGDILLAEALRAEAASKSLLAECLANESHQAESLRTGTIPSVSLETDSVPAFRPVTEGSRTEPASSVSSETDHVPAFSPVTASDTAVHEEPTTSATDGRQPESIIPQR